VREGKGGIQALGDDDKDSIKRSIDEDVLKRSAIEFRSRSVTDGPTIRVDGDLRLLGSTRPISFELKIGDDRRLTGSATIRQREWGIKPYTILFGTLKVADEVQVTVDATLEG
jgi:polyisoprenoid-binding protein YceI